MAEHNARLEQDAVNFGHDLPTYDDLATNAGPNSRFGRWRSWIEKRAAERYADDPRSRIRSRARGWGEGVDTFDDGDEEIYGDDSLDEGLGRISIEPPPEEGSSSATLPSYSPRYPPLSSIPVEPCRLQVLSFGSRFLHHVTAPPRTLMPVLGDRLIFIGHDDGLSVLNMFPEDFSGTGIPSVKGPDEAQARVLWLGESVRQLVVIEENSTGGGTPTGVVLALVGASEMQSPSSKDAEWTGTLRMYNLSSLVSLGKWSIQQDAQPLDLRKLENGNPMHLGTIKKHQKRLSGSLPKSLFSLGGDSSADRSLEMFDRTMPTASSFDSRSVRSVNGKGKQTSLDSAWDVIDDLPLRWATDYVPLASSGSRLANTSVLFFELFREPSAPQGTLGHSLLAIATKTSILLYETPKGQRSFCFVKEFYTPLQPKQITFVQQSVLENPFGRRISDVGPALSSRSSDTSSRSASMRDRAFTSSNNRLQYGAHLSLFIIFDKRAGTIRLADSAVAEVELYDVEHLDVVNHSPRKSKLGRESGFSKDLKRSWVPPACVQVPPLIPESLPYTLYLLTKGKSTHILRAPLPVIIAKTPPLRILSWKSPPNRVWARISRRPRASHVPMASLSLPVCLQVTALSDNGVEAQEVSLAFLLEGREKTRAIIEDAQTEPVRGLADVGGAAGYLEAGGHWQDLTTLDRSSSIGKQSSPIDDGSDWHAREQGVYGWARKGLEDWRIIWLGPTGLD